MSYAATGVASPSSAGGTAWAAAGRPLSMSIQATTAASSATAAEIVSPEPSASTKADPAADCTEQCALLPFLVSTSSYVLAGLAQQ